MKTNCLFLFSVLFFLYIHPLHAQDSLLTILEKEMNREFNKLKEQAIPAYYLAYRVSDIEEVTVTGSHGCLEQVHQNNRRILTPTIRVGSPEYDNFHPARGNGAHFLGVTELPVDNNETAIATLLWKATGEAYEKAVATLGRIKGQNAMNVGAQDQSPDFSREEPAKYQEPVRKIGVDSKSRKLLSQKVAEYSAPFYNNINITHSSVTYSIRSIRKYFVSTEGAAIAENFNYIQLQVACQGTAADGMNLPLFKTYFANDWKDLPSDEEVLAEVRNMVSKIIDLRKAPLVEAYSGPALLSGAATGVFFHEIFGHRIEASRMKTIDDAQTFKKKINEQVLNPALSVLFDPTIRNYRGFQLNGSFRYDDEGIEGRKVVVVEKGILKDFLTCRTPISEFPKSNGHGRASEGLAPVSRQSNLLLETDSHLSEGALRDLFIEELKKQNLEFGYFFKEVIGGFTFTGRTIPNAFNVIPVEVYRIYTDGRPNELVRGVNLIGTPLAMFSEIEAAGGEYDVFNGYCGAASGQVPVSSVCPMMLVKKIELQKQAVPRSNMPPIGQPE